MKARTCNPAKVAGRHSQSRASRRKQAVQAYTLDEPDLVLHASCDRLRSAGARPLWNAQAQGTAKPDIYGDDLFALVDALGWIVEQLAFAPRADHLLELMPETILAKR